MAIQVNGRMYDWASIEIGIAGMPIPSFTSIEYSDEADVKHVHGRGSRPVGYARGNYTANGKITLHREAYEGLAAGAKALGFGSFYSMKPFPITVTYANPDKPPITDVIKGVLPKKRSASNSQNQDAATIDIEFIAFEIQLGPSDTFGSL